MVACDVVVLLFSEVDPRCGSLLSEIDEWIFVEVGEKSYKVKEEKVDDEDDEVVSPHEISGYIADAPVQEQFRIAEELQETIRASTKLGIKYDDAGVLRMKKMIEQEAKDLESMLRDNPFAPLQRKKLHPKAPKE
ncbi:hypothetical protein RHSIM_RhsimUnG0038800 [Rhododendron simsii]|uniref:Uncharacterized protein n=1 Tax=Rhododendron simsii TaxID=118357 RepID=A0A834FXG0_RHOSS|nr:hypothetical protein RHSIM_RhsimUnG0038800 [Rhododendron simsii]